MMLRACLVFLISVTILGVAGSQDKSTYYTVTHPDEFTIDWKAFYDKADEMTAAVRKELQHHLDLPYGSHSKQKLDIYLPRGKSNSAPVLVFFLRRRIQGRRSGPLRLRGETFRRSGHHNRGCQLSFDARVHVSRSTE